MGHKVSPISFRIPLVKTWKSSWYADKKDYAKSAVADIQMRDFLKKELNGKLVGDIRLYRGQEEVTVDIFTAKPAMVNGKEGEGVAELVKKLEKKFGLKFSVNVKEIKKPEINATLVADSVARQIEKRMPYKRVIKMAISRAMEKGAKGVKVIAGGRLNGVEIARRETYKDGNIPTQTIRADIDYATDRAETVYGTIGIKVWIYKGQVFKKK
ncbi:MAG: 30S ribosomal protein S3 [Candidatus Gracilibacteria bacterium]|nr:30S ribosomal protein S3 [Candidatus Gracilibacteria bacterium]